MTIYENNIKELKKSNSRIIKQLDDINASRYTGQYFIDTAKNGNKILAKKEDEKIIYFNSRYNPIEEAKKVLSNIEKIVDASIFVMFGFANGSFIRELLDRKTDATYIIYEPDINAFWQVVNNIDITDILSNERVFIVTGADAEDLLKSYLAILIDVEKIKYTQMKSIPIYEKIFPDEFLLLKNAFDHAYTYAKANMSTAINISYKATYTGVHNLRYLYGCRSALDYYCDVFPKNLPAIVVSAGPSLEKNVDVLRNAKGKALIVAVDTALKHLVSKGVIPDVVFTLDCMKTVELFDVENISDIFFFVEMVSNTEVLDFIKSKNLVFYSAESPAWGHLFSQAGSEIRTVRAGGSVATEAIANLIAMGFNKVILVGQDLAFTNNKQYAGGEVLSEEDQKLASEGKILQNGNYSRSRRIKDIYGNDVYTSGDYYMYIKEIERFGYLFKETEIIDATEGGAFKKNTTIMTLKEALDKYCTKEYDIRGILETPRVLFTGEDETLVENMLKEMTKELNSFEKMLADGIVHCKKAKKMLENNDYKINELRHTNDLISKIDNKFLELKTRTMIMGLVPWAEYEFYNDFYTEEEDHIKESIRIYTKSIDYYSSIKDGVKALKKMVKECKEKVQEEHGKK